jgi:hypothetical protein
MGILVTVARRNEPFSNPILLLVLLATVVAFVRPLDGGSTSVGDVLGFPGLPATAAVRPPQTLQCRPQVRMCGGRPSASRLRRGMQTAAVAVGVPPERQRGVTADEPRRQAVWLVTPPTPPPRPIPAASIFA